MRIQQLVQPLSTELSQALQAIGIKTDTDLLLARDPLTVFARLPAGHGVTLKQFRDALAQVAELASAPPIYGDKLFEQEMKRQEDVYADDILLGVPEVDALLGGFNPPRVIELSGDAGSGKTALALQVALRHLTRIANSSVLWIDTGGEFSPERVALLLEQLGGAYSATALERLQVSLAFDIETAHEVLEAVRQALSAAADLDAEEMHESASASPITRCIVVDNITSLLGPMLSATSSQGHAIMTTFMRQLRAFADSFSLTIIVINASTKVGPRSSYTANPEAVFETGRKPGLGPSFTFMTDATLWLTRRSRRDEQEGEADSTVHTAEVFRSRITRSKTWAQFVIRNGLLVSA